jgi:hypothetical protein
MMTQSDATVLACQLKNVRLPDGVYNVQLRHGWMHVQLSFNDYISAFGSKDVEEWSDTYYAMTTVHCGVTFFTLIEKEGD